jgi:predicted GNAT family N-acyltransferase
VQDSVTFCEIAFGSDDYRREFSLRDEVLRAPLGLSLTAKDISDEAGQMHFGLFEPEGTLVACVIAVPLSQIEAKIRQMAVLTSRQRQGFGAKIMGEVERVLRAKGFSKLVLHARVSVAGFYRRLGYSAVGDEFVEVTIPHVRMEKAI